MQKQNLVTIKYSDKGENLLLNNLVSVSTEKDSNSNNNEVVVVTKLRYFQQNIHFYNGNSAFSYNDKKYTCEYIKVNNGNNYKI